MIPRRPHKSLRSASVGQIVWAISVSSIALPIALPSDSLAAGPSPHLRECRQWSLPAVDSEEWRRISVRVPDQPLIDERYPLRLHQSLEATFRPWFEKISRTSIIEQLRRQHAILAGGASGAEIYHGASRRSQNIAGGFHAVPGKFRHELFPQSPDAEWTVQIQIARELIHDLPDDLPDEVRVLRDRYSAALAERSLVEPLTEREFLEWLDHEKIPAVPEIKIPISGLGEAEWPRIQVYQNFIRHIYGRHGSVPTYVLRTAALLTQIRDSEVRSDVDLAKLLDLLSDYAHLGGNAHLFNVGNFSLTMSHVNYVLNHHGLRGISHGHLDYRALIEDFTGFRRRFRRAVVQENPTLARLPAPQFTTNREFVTVVVPVYRELENGNLLRFLESFTKQRDTRFGFVFLFDNPAELGSAVDSAGVMENARTRELIEYLAHQTPKKPGFLAKSSVAETRLIRSIRQMNFEMQNLAPVFGDTDRNIGRLRNTGVSAVIERSRRAGVESIIAMMDADNLVPPHYVGTIIDELRDGRRRSLILPLTFRVEPGSNRHLYQTTFHERYWFAWEQLNAALRNQPELSVAGSQIVATSETLRDVGGVPPLYKHEDLQLAKNLARQGGLAFAPDAEVINADRARAQGFIAARRMNEMETGAHWNWLHPHIDPVRILLEEALEKSKRGGRWPNPGVVAEVFRYFGFPFDIQVWGDHAPHSESAPEMLHALLGEPSQEFGEVFPDRTLARFLKLKLAPKEWRLLSAMLTEVADAHAEEIKRLRHQLRKIAAEGRIATLSSTEFLAGNVWILPELRSLEARGLNPEEAINVLEKDFGDWLKPFGETPLKARVQRMTVLARALYRMRQQPHLFPSSIELFNWVDGNALNGK